MNFRKERNGMIKKLRNPVRRLSLILTTGFFVLAAFGCGGGGGSSSDSTPTTPPTTPGTPSLSTQGALDFGVVVIPQTARTISRVVTITNTGNANLAIGQIALQQLAGTPSFVIVGDGCSITGVTASGTCQVSCSIHHGANIHPERSQYTFSIFRQTMQ